MATAYAVSASVKVGGADLPDELTAHIEQIVVDDDLGRPAMFAITFIDSLRDILGRTGLKAGKEVEIEVMGQGDDEDGSLIRGDVVSVEVDYDEVGSRVIVRGYDATHRLQRGHRTRAFSNVTDSDIITKVAQEAGIQVGSIQPTSEVHEHVSQANLTDYDFIAARADALDMDLVMVDGKLGLEARATPADAPSELDLESPRNLVYGHNLVSFHGRVTAAQQVDTIQVRGYDAARKVAVTGSAPAKTKTAAISFGEPKALASVFGPPAYVDVSAPVRTDREAEDAAKAIAERIGSAATEVEGAARGSTALRAGVAVRVSRVSEEFSGAYVLSRVRHVIDGSGYRTQFWVSGRHDRSLLGLVSAATSGSAGSGAGSARPSQRGATRLFGVFRALVADNADPENLGRVTIKLPWLEESWVSRWAPVVQLGAGPDRGTLFLPAVDDEVLVAFEHGDVNRPVVVGGLFNNLDKPPSYADYLDNGAVVGRGIFSRNGHQITFHDRGDAEGIILRANDDGKSTAVSVGLNGKDQKLVAMSRDAIEVKADGEIVLKGSKVTVEAAGELVLKGAMVKIN